MVFLLERLVIKLLSPSCFFKFNFGKLNAVLSGNVNNLFDQTYISDATDGSNHDWKTAYNVFYGFGRTYSLRLKVNF